MVNFRTKPSKSSVMQLSSRWERFENYHEKWDTKFVPLWISSLASQLNQSLSCALNLALLTCSLLKISSHKPVIRWPIPRRGTLKTHSNYWLRWLATDQLSHWYTFGRPTVSWYDNIKEWTGIQYERATRIAVGREKWKATALSNVERYGTRRRRHPWCLIAHDIPFS